MVSTKKLSERDAYAIALAWRDDLQGCVRLETERHGGAAATTAPMPPLVPVFAHVTFVLNGALVDGLRDVKDTKDTAASARAATLAWFALSCCTGFSAHENPHFWRRVFSELHALPPAVTRRAASNATKKPYAYRAQQPISDAVRFFDGAYGVQFPRVKFVAKFPQDGASVRAFLAASDGVDRKLQKLLKKLTHFVRPSLWSQRSISVAIEGLQVDELLKVITSLPPDKGPTNSMLASLPSPTIRVETIVLRRQDTRCTAAIQDLKSLTHAYIVVEDCEFSHLFHTHRGPVDSLLRPLDDDATSTFSIQTLSLARSIGSRTKFAVVCSALPYVDSLRSVELTATRFEVKAMGSDEWAWLGYAVFHPDTAKHTSFSHLDLRLPYVRDVAQHVRAFKSMATGNNVLTALGYDAPTSSGYYTARLRTGALVRLESADGASTEVELASASRCTLCINSTDRSALADWTQAVIPGYGLGWIRRHDGQEIAVAAPGKSCVRHLKLTFPDVVNDDGEIPQWLLAAMLVLLSVLGQDLVSLDLLDSLSMDTNTVQAILDRCPSLKTLRISHDGAFWQHEESVPMLPRLVELELSVDATADVTTGLKALRSTSLVDLRVLRVQTARNESFDMTHRSFLTTLATLPTILYGHWLYAGKSSHFTTYEKRRLHSLSLQRNMDCGQSDVSQVPMRLDGKLAFVGVVRDASMDSSGLSLFGPDVLRNIFSFSTSPEPRSVYIGCD